MVSFSSTVLAAILGISTLTLGAELNSSASTPFTALPVFYPSCAVACYAGAIGLSPCAAADTACICADGSLRERIWSCTPKTCPFLSTQIARNLTAHTCNESPRDKSQPLPAILWPFNAVIVVFVALRFWMRVVMAGRMPTAEDWILLTSFVSGLVVSVLTLTELWPRGLGVDTWSIPFDQLQTMMLWSYFVQLLYFLPQGLFRTQLLIFYTVVFPRLRRVAFITIAVNAFFILAAMVGSALQCQPVPYFWRRFNLEEQGSGSCMDSVPFLWVHSLSSIALDLWMLALPIKHLLGLQLQFKLKLGVALMFFLGILVTIIGVARLFVAVVNYDPSNLTYENYKIGLWSTLELNFGIICACLPSLRLLLTRAWRQMRASVSNYRGSTPDDKADQPSSAGARPLESGAAAKKSLVKSVTLSSDSGSGTQSLTTYVEAHSCHVPACGTPGRQSCSGISRQRSYSVSYGESPLAGEDIEQEKHQKKGANQRPSPLD